MKMKSRAQGIDVAPSIHPTKSLTQHYPLFLAHFSRYPTRFLEPSFVKPLSGLTEGSHPKHHCRVCSSFRT